MADLPQGISERLGKVFELTLPKLEPEAQRQLSQLITPGSLATMAGAVALWIAGHAFGVGEFVDVILAIVGWFSIELAVFSGLDELLLFAGETYLATGDLNRAADYLAKAIDILGVQAVLAVLFRNRPRADIGQVEGVPRPKATFEVEKPPAPTPGTAYKPTVTAAPFIPGGSGSTSWWGDITISTQSSTADRALVLLHERVHQVMTPKLYALRNVRVLGRAGSYVGSSLYRYFEEMLAETIAKVGVQGFQKFFVGIRFPVYEGYVYLIRTGSDPALANWGGRGLVPEGAGLLAGVTAAGMLFQLWFKVGTPPDVLKDERARRR